MALKEIQHLEVYSQFKLIPKNQGVYMIKNNVNKKMYIGATTNKNSNCYERVRYHLGQLIYGTHFCAEMQIDWNLNKSNFQVVFLDEDYSKEEHYQRYYNSVDIGYNRKYGSESGMTGKFHSKTSKDMISKSNKGKNSGRTMAEFTRQKMSKSRTQENNKMFDPLIRKKQSICSKIMGKKRIIENLINKNLDVAKSVYYELKDLYQQKLKINNEISNKV